MHLRPIAPVIDRTIRVGIDRIDDLRFGTPNAMISLSSYLSLSSPMASIARGVKALNMQAATSGVALRAASIIV